MPKKIADYNLDEYPVGEREVTGEQKQAARLRDAINQIKMQASRGKTDEQIRANLKKYGPNPPRTDEEIEYAFKHRDWNPFGDEGKEWEAELKQKKAKAEALHARIKSAAGESGRTNPRLAGKYKNGGKYEILDGGEAIDVFTGIAMARKAVNWTKAGGTKTGYQIRRISDGKIMREDGTFAGDVKKTGSKSPKAGTSKTKFMFRNKPYYVEDVVKQVLDFVHDASNSGTFKRVFDDAKSKHPRPRYTEAQIKMYGKDYYDDMLQKWDINVAKEAVASFINKGFEKVMGAGVTNNPYAPNNIAEVDRSVIEKTLGKIRAVRKNTVQRSYSARKNPRV